MRLQEFHEMGHKKVGMVPGGRRKRQAFWEGKEMNIVHMARFREGPEGFSCNFPPRA